MGTATGTGGVNNNTAIGDQAGVTVTTGTGNVFVGAAADSTLVGNVDGIAIGRAAKTNHAGAIVIGAGVTSAAGNDFILGTASHNVQIPGTLKVKTMTYRAADGASGTVLTTNGSGTLSWTSKLATTGDIAPGVFTGAEGNITGFAFSNATVRAFEALVSVYVDATTDQYASYKIHGVQKAASWEISTTSVGTDDPLYFTITTAGQIQYTLYAPITGFSAIEIRFRAQALTYA
jgi:hypothetical protein